MATYDEWCDELQGALAEPFPDDAHKTLSKGGTNIIYVEWADYVERINALVGVNGWSSRMGVTVAGDTLVVNYELTILGVAKASLGDEKLTASGYGSVATNAEAQAKKRAFAQFGCGLYLYDKTGGNRKGGGKPVGKPRAKSTPKTSTQPPPELPMDGSYVIPKGDWKDRRIDDPDIPMSYLIRTADEMPPKYRAVFESEINRRMKATKR
jgi:hypothetical protein